MSATRVSVLTPAGSAAIAVLAVRGPRAWEIVARHFQSQRPLGEPHSYPCVRFGRFGASSADEVIVIIRRPQHVEIHCHGGRQVVAWLVNLLRGDGVEETPWTEAPSQQFADPAAAALLPFARTVRTAAILLDQAHGAYERALGLAATDPAVRDALRRNAGVGRHLVEPWAVALAGKPNAGKSTLLNALAGFDRSVVSPIPGTTRDAVTVSLAFDGWPVDVTDTAGLREAADLLEEEGVRRAQAALATSDLCIWVADASAGSAPDVEQVAETVGRPPDSILLVLNKCDLELRSESIQSSDEAPSRKSGDIRYESTAAIRVSARTREGVPELAALIATLLAPNPPRPGAPVPFTPDRCACWS